jgi:hypothetical protein
MSGPSDADRIEAALPDALALAGAVRRRDYDVIQRCLWRRTYGRAPQRDLYALVIVLAAALPDDTPLPDLLAWVAEWPPPITPDDAADHRAELAQALTERPHR